MQHRIIDKASLKAAASSPRGQTIEFALPGMADDQARVLGRRATALSCACGCDAASASVIVAVLLCIAGDLALWPTAHARPYAFAAADLLACFLSIGLGRAIGIAHAHRELRNLYAAVGRTHIKGP